MEGKMEVSVREDQNQNLIALTPAEDALCVMLVALPPPPFPSRPLRTHAHTHAHDTGTWICTIYGVSDQGATLTQIK